MYSINYKLIINIINIYYKHIKYEGNYIPIIRTHLRIHIKPLLEFPR